MLQAGLYEAAPFAAVPWGRKNNPACCFLHLAGALLPCIASRSPALWKLDDFRDIFRPLAGKGQLKCMGALPDILAEALHAKCFVLTGEEVPTAASGRGSHRPPLNLKIPVNISGTGLQDCGSPFAPLLDILETNQPPKGARGTLATWGPGD